MEVRINTYDGNTVIMQIGSDDWKQFLNDVLSAGWIGCDGFWSGIKNVASIVQIPETSPNITPIKPELKIVPSTSINEGGNVP